jgi:hypothetical protein
MLRAQIEELKANIKDAYDVKINKLKEEMEDALASLSKVEERIFNVEAIPLDKPVKTPTTIIRRTRYSIPHRINAALEKVNGQFTRKELFQMALDDGGVSVAKGSLAAIFSDLVKKNIIIVVKEAMGKTAGIYKKAE